MTADDDLERFVTAQDQADTYDGALRELRAGRKSGHWMWFIFPQLGGLGRSESLEVLRASGRSTRRAPTWPTRSSVRDGFACAATVAGLEGTSAVRVLGRGRRGKLRSSMTLFGSADPDQPVFHQVLDRWYDGRADPLTLERLGMQERKEP